MAAIVSSGYIANQHCLNRYDFNLCLKTGKLREGSLKSSGSLFQRAGPEVAKLHGPIVFVFVLGPRRSPLAVERRRERTGTVDFQCKHLREVCRSDTMTRRPNLKSILERIRSQCRRSRMSAEIGSNLRFRRTRITVCS